MSKLAKQLAITDFFHRQHSVRRENVGYVARDDIDVASRPLAHQQYGSVLCEELEETVKPDGTRTVKRTTTFHPKREREAAQSVEAFDGAPKRQRECAVVGQRQSFTFHEKRTVIREVLATSISFVAVKRQIPPSTVESWMEGRIEIEHACECGHGDSRRLQPLRKYRELFERAFDVYLQARDILLAVNTATLREYCAAKNDDFRSLSLRSQQKEMKVFKQHFGLTLRRRTGICQLVPQDSDQRVADYHRLLGSLHRASKFTHVVVCDETSVLRNPSSNTTLARRGEKHVTVRVRDEKSSATVLLAAVHSINDDKTSLIRPQVIFVGSEGSRGRVLRDVTTRYCDVAVTENGWQTGRSFCQWVADHCSPCTREKRCLLVMDLYCAHRTPEVLNLLIC
jgi:hypothetical protein